MQKKRELPIEKVEMHPRNKHRQRYNLKELCISYPELTAFVKLNEYGIFGVEKTVKEALDNFKNELFETYELYRDIDDGKLTKDAILLKKRLINQFGA